MPNHFIGFLRWLLLKRDSFESVIFLYKSRVNPDSPRFIPLFWESKNTRVVLFHGLKLPKTDWLMLKVFVICERLAIHKIEQYEWYHVIGTSSNAKINQALHIDDPTYSKIETQNIAGWNDRMRKDKLDNILIVTNQHSRNYFSKNFPDLEIEIVEQGFTQATRHKVKKNINFSCVYSSPFIDYGSDRHSNHVAWGSQVLIEEIIPELLKLDPKIEVHLIGKLGRDAMKEISRFSNVICHGYVDRYENARILQTCHISIHPRIHDNFRAVQKIGEYIGAGNPIVAFRLVDTSIVNELSLGIIVENSRDFVHAILSLRNSEEYSYYAQNLIRAKSEFTWAKLASKLDLIISMQGSRN